MKSKKLRRVLTGHVTALSVAVIIVSIPILLVISWTGRKKELRIAEDRVSLARDGLAVTDTYITELMYTGTIGEQYQNILWEFTEGSDLYQKDGKYFIRSAENKKKNQKINSDYPLLMDNGAYFYLYHDQFSLITDEIKSLQAESGTYLSDGMVFNQEHVRTNTNPIVLLGLPNGLYINTTDLRIDTGNQLETIDSGSVIRFEKTEVSYCTIYVKKPKLMKITVDDITGITGFADDNMSYATMFSELTDQEEEHNQDTATEESYPLTEDVYQYFLGNRYDYPAGNKIYRSEEGFFMETAETRFLLPNTPLYSSSEDKMILPCDYAIIQPKLYLMNRLPVLSQLICGEEVVYAFWEDQQRTYQDIILFDGTDTYLFFDQVTLTWGENEITLSPLSFVRVTAQGNLETFDYETQQYSNSFIDGNHEVQAITSGLSKLNLSEDILYRPDGQEQLLFSKPSLLQNVQ